MSNGRGRTIDHGGDLGGSLGLHPGDDVGVLLQRERRRLVTEEIISTVHTRRAPMMHASAGLAL
jgi:hypothetical protein